MRAQKPTLESHSKPCCGECVAYCHKAPDGAVRCFLNPPVYAYGAEEEAVFLRPEVDVKDPACQHFNRKVN